MQFGHVWKKYLPVISILIKRSVHGEQVLSMNHTDFERAAGGKKAKFNFSTLRLNKGRLDTLAKHSPVARELAQVLQEEEPTRVLVRNHNLEFAMNGNFQLTIRNTTPPSQESPVAEVNEPVQAGTA
ncbi:MAG TPA: hypothetical protein VG870_05425 [Chitinophagaceae bacterium]|nr:hypothetical protein [Chitinophagaceae bacterium]